MAGIASYLQPGRLADVLALIQVLAYDADTYRTETGLDDEMQRKPSTGATWIAMASEHPEFFRVRADPTRPQRVALLARYVLPHELRPDGTERRPALEVTVANKLMELAIQLHDKQLERQTRWKTVVIPMTVAVIAALTSMFGAFRISGKPAAPIVLQLPAFAAAPHTQPGPPAAPTRP